MVKLGTSRVFQLGSGLSFAVPAAWRAEFDVRVGRTLWANSTMDGTVRYTLKRNEYGKPLKMRKWNGGALLSVRMADARGLGITVGTILELATIEDGTLLVRAQTV